METREIDGAEAAALLERLPVEPWEAGLYERLMDLPHAQFSALFAEILLGNLSVHDTAPLLDVPDPPAARVGLLDALAAKTRGIRHARETSAAAGKAAVERALAGAGMHRGFAAWLETHAAPRMAETAWRGLSGGDAARKREQLEGVRLAGA